MVANLVLARLLNIPTSSLKGRKQHSANLVGEGDPCWSAAQASNRPEYHPLNPLAKVVREKNVMRQTILGHHVELLNTCDGLVIFLGLLSLAT